MQVSEESQVIVPPSFVDLYLPPGRTRPTAPREEIAARHEICDDLAQALTEHARTVLWRHGVTEQDVLERIHNGLQEEGSGLSPDEARWVSLRLAELLEWRDVHL